MLGGFDRVTGRRRESRVILQPSDQGVGVEPQVHSLDYSERSCDIGRPFVEVLSHFDAAAHGPWLILGNRDYPGPRLGSTTHNNLLSVFGLVHEFGELGLGFAEAVAGCGEKIIEVDQLGQPREAIDMYQASVLYIDGVAKHLPDIDDARLGDHRRRFA